MNKYPGAYRGNAPIAAFKLEGFFAQSIDLLY